MQLSIGAGSLFSPTRQKGQQMNFSIHNSHSYLFAGLATAAVLACLLLVRTTNLTGPMPSLRSPALARKVVAPEAVPQPAPAPPAAVVIPDAAVIPTTVASTATGITMAAMIIPAALVLPVVEVTQNTGLSDENRAFFTQALQSGIQQDQVSRGVLPRLVYTEVREYAYMVITD